METIVFFVLAFAGSVIGHSFYDIPYTFSEEFEREAMEEEPRYNRDYYPRNVAPNPQDYGISAQTTGRASFPQDFILADPLQAQPQSRSRIDKRAKVADEILKDMDLSVSPCENFYQYACGGFIRNQTLSSGFTYKLGSIATKIIHAIRSGLEESSITTEPRPLTLAKRLYRSCMNEGRIEIGANHNMLSLIRELGGWPTLGFRTPTRLDLEGKLASCYAFFGNAAASFTTGGAIIGLRVIRDLFQVGTFSFYIDRPTLGMHGIAGSSTHELYLLPRNSVYMTAYIRYGVEIAVALGADYRTAVRDMNALVDFEIQLARIMSLDNGQLQRVTVAELSLRYPAFDWLRFLRLIGRSVGVSINITPSERVIIWSRGYYTRLFQLLQRTTIRTLKNYLIWRSILPFMSAMNREFQVINLRYQATVNGARRPLLLPRRSFCTRIVRNQMPWVAGRILVEKKISRSTIEMATHVTRYVRHSFRQLLTSSTWLDETTRTNTLTKFDRIKDEIGFPSYLFDNAWLDNLYKDFVLQRYSFFQNTRELLTQNFANSVKQLTDPQLDRWIMSPVAINAMYERVRNAVTFSSALIDEPVFHVDYPLSLNFGAYGFFTAHEYQHAFDTFGIRIDWNGLLNQQFWSTSSKNTFNRKLRCFIRQLSNYFLPDIGLRIRNGGKVINEALPDFVGVKAAFDAYQAWKRVSRRDDRLQGLPFTGDQLFFISNARIWCSKFSRVYAHKFPLVANHPLNRLRVIAPLQNLEEFSSTFQCPVGSPMNPRNKCSLW